MSKTVVVLGKGTLAIQVAEWFQASPEHKLLAVVPVVPEPAWTASFTAWAESVGIQAIESGRYEDLPLADGDTVADLGISVFYDRIFKANGIAKFGRLMNIHNAPLPKYRGVSPINWALKNCERQHGVTIHEISPGIDDGPIVGQVSYSIYPEFDEVEDVYQRALRYAWLMFKETAPLFDQIVARPQSDADATHYTRKDNHQLGDRASWRRGANWPQK